MNPKEISPLRGSSISRCALANPPYISVVVPLCLAAMLCGCASPAVTPDEAKARAERLVRPHAAALIAGLKKSPIAITMGEFNIINDEILNHPGMDLIIYVDRRRGVRWYMDVSSIWDVEFVWPLETDAALRAYRGKQTVVRGTASGIYYEVAVPLHAETDVLGVLVFAALLRRSDDNN